MAQKNPRLSAWKKAMRHGCKAFSEARFWLRVKRNSTELLTDGQLWADLCFGAACHTTLASKIVERSWEKTIAVFFECLPMPAFNSINSWSYSWFFIFLENNACLQVPCGLGVRNSEKDQQGRQWNGLTAGFSSVNFLKVFHFMLLYFEDSSYTRASVSPWNKLPRLQSNGCRAHSIDSPHWLPSHSLPSAALASQPIKLPSHSLPSPALASQPISFPATHFPVQPWLPSP